MVTDEMVEAGCKANFKWYLGEWITEDQRDIARQQVRTILEAALSPAEPVAEVLDKPGGFVFSIFPEAFHRIHIGDKLYADPPAPSVAVKALHQAASDFMHLFIQDGHLTMQDLEDTDLIPAYEKLSAALSAQVQDVAGLLDETWNAAVEQDAAIANDCVHLTPDPGAAIRTMLNGRTKVHPAAPAKQER